MLSSHTDYVMLLLVAHVANKERILKYFIHLFEVFIDNWHTAMAATKFYFFHTILSHPMLRQPFICQNEESKCEVTYMQHSIKIIGKQFSAA